MAIIQEKRGGDMKKRSKTKCYRVQVGIGAHKMVSKCLLKEEAEQYRNIIDKNCSGRILSWVISPHKKGKKRR